MVVLGRAVSVLVILTAVHFSLGREPVPFVCTNKETFQGNTQIRSGTESSTSPDGTTGSSAPPETTNASCTPSDETTGSSAFSESTKDLSPDDDTTHLSSIADSATKRSSPSDDTTGLSVAPSGDSEKANEQFIFTFLPVQCDFHVTSEIFIGTKFSDTIINGTIFFPLTNISNIKFSLERGNGQIIAINSTAVPSESNLNQAVNTSVVVTADREVVVYGHQQCSGSGNYRATAFNVRGIGDLGTEYWLVTHQTKGRSQAAVVVTEDHTNIKIAGIHLNKTLNLNKYEVFYFGGSFDLTGTHIVTDKPILVIAGNSADISLYAGENPDTDSFYKCFPPVKDWGNNFVLVPFPPTTIENITARVLSAYDNCTIEHTEDGELRVITLAKGAYKDIQTSQVLKITSSKLILVAQFSQDEKVNSKTVNPSMLLISPVNLTRFGRRECVFPVFSNGRGHVDVWLTPGSQSSDLRLDNNNVTWRAEVSQSNIVIVRTTSMLARGSHIVKTNGNFIITAVVYGPDNHRYYSFITL